LPNLTTYSNISHPNDLLKATGVTIKWINREISNFDYLMLLNTIAGRSYNDLSQYPIFPWILNDYKSAKLDLTKSQTFRDLSKPIGALNAKYAEYVKQKYDSFEDATGANMKPFHYGTHYSNSANVMHFLIRLEPFTSLHIQLQSNKFDVADRQFHSIESTWQILIDNPTDVKELIPEFFYLPEFLENVNHLDLGELQVTRTKVDSVSLPAWATTSEQFIAIHRKALECDYISEHLNEWIDLIFGYKQNGLEAEKALNVFMECTYEDGVNIEAINDPLERRAMEDMISNFGQTPTQLFKEQHPKRKTLKQALLDWELQLKPISLFHQLNDLKAYYVELSSEANKSTGHEDPVVYIEIPRSLSKSFMQQGPTDPLITITQSGLIGIHGWQAFERSMRNLFTFEKDPSLLNERTKRYLSGPFDPSIKIERKLFAVTHDFKLLISGGHWDSSLRVFSLTKNRTLAQIYEHKDTVTCVSIDNCGTYVISGSKDTTCALWKVQQEMGTSIGLNATPVHVFYGHTDEVTCVDISIEFDLILSGSKDGTINIHNIKNGQFIKTLILNEQLIVNLKFGEERHFAVYSLNQNTNNILSIYSINGRLVCQEKIAYPIDDIIVTNNNCILALDKSLNAKDGFKSKIVFKDLIDLKTIQSMRLKAQIKSLFLTKEYSHLLVGLKDEKLIVITGEKPSKVFKS
jgi:neurobeachin-like protein 1/2